MTPVRLNFQVMSREEENVCDFCGQTPIVWRYPCETFDSFVIETEEQIVTGTSTADWMACDTCHALIERDERTALIERVLLKPMQFSGVEVPNDIARVFIAELHQQFFTHRTGDAVRI